MRIIEGLAPQALGELETPTHAFVGGSSGNLREIVQLLQKKNPDVRIVINAISLETVSEVMGLVEEGILPDAEIISGEDHRSYDVNMFYRSYHVDIVDTQKKYLRMRKSAEEKQDDKIVAPMPGKVVKIPVRKGDRLETGDTVVVLEAMKMQSNYKVSSACVVKDILVSEGDSVDNNQVLMTLDLLKDDSYE